MTFTLPLPKCDACRVGRHDECVEQDWPYDHQGSNVRVCWCVKCSWDTTSGEHKGSTITEEGQG